MKKIEIQELSLETRCLLYTKKELQIEDMPRNLQTEHALQFIRELRRLGKDDPIEIASAARDFKRFPAAFDVNAHVALVSHGHPNFGDLNTKSDNGFDRLCAGLDSPDPEQQRRFTALLAFIDDRLGDLSQAELLPIFEVLEQVKITSVRQAKGRPPMSEDEKGRGHSDDRQKCIEIDRIVLQGQMSNADAIRHVASLPADSPLDSGDFRRLSGAYKWKRNRRGDGKQEGD